MDERGKRGGGGVGGTVPGVKASVEAGMAHRGIEEAGRGRVCTRGGGTSCIGRYHYAAAGTGEIGLCIMCSPDAAAATLTAAPPPSPGQHEQVLRPTLLHKQLGESAVCEEGAQHLQDLWLKCGCNVDVVWLQHGLGVDERGLDVDAMPPPKLLALLPPSPRG